MLFGNWGKGGKANGYNMAETMLGKKSSVGSLTISPYKVESSGQYGTHIKAGTVTRACNPITEEANAGTSRQPAD